MSQKVVITGVRMTGHAYLGEQIQPDKSAGSLRSRLLACDERDCLVGVAGVVS